MPHATEPQYQYITVKKLHPTVGAEVSGIDFSKPVPPEVFQEVHQAITEVSLILNMNSMHQQTVKNDDEHRTKSDPSSLASSSFEKQDSTMLATSNSLVCSANSTTSNHT